MYRPSNRLLRGALVAGITVTALIPSAVRADPNTKPNGPWPTDEQAIELGSLRSYDELWKTLRMIERSSQGAMELFAAPRLTNLDREIPVAKIGDGPTGVMIIAQQHGNEYMVSNGALELVRDLAGNSQSDRAIHEALTVLVVPRVNVDGFDGDATDAFGNTPPWRQNYDPFCVTGPCPPFYQRGRGYDINRYHSYLPDADVDPYTGAPGNPVPESLAMRLLYDAYQPDFVMDLHHQGSYVDDAGDLITGSTMWPNATAAAADLGIEAEFADAVELSKQVVATMVNELDRYGFANITRYPGTTTPGIARNAYGLLGAGSVLFEMRGGTGQKAAGYIAKTAYLAAKSVVEAAADGSLYTTDTTPADELPERGPFVGAPNEDEHEEGGE